MYVEERYADFVVIGSGPAGQKGAIQAAKLGKKVIVIERDAVPGGASLNSGTIPSKSLREAILDLTDFYERSFYGQNRVIREISINDLNFRLNIILEEQRKMLLRQFEKNHIEVIHGNAAFQDKNEIAVFDEQHEKRYRIKADHFLIATGSKPRNPLNIPFDEKRILDSTRLLSIDRVPKTMIVLGGGIVEQNTRAFLPP